MTDNTPVIKVMIVDDHEMVRLGLSGFLAAFPDLQLVGEASNGALAVTLSQERQPDVILMDLMMPEMDGISAIRMIRQNQPQVQIIALTSAKDPDLIHSALQAGAIGYVLKDISIHELGAAIRSAFAGKPTLSSEVLHSLVRSTEQTPRPALDLTSREIEVLSLLARGFNNPEIAEHLMVSRSTVKTHLSNIFAKLGVNNRTEAVTLALRYRLISE